MAWRGRPEAQADFPTDERVTFELGDVAAAPGETEVWIPFSLRIEPGAPAVYSWEVAIRFDPAVLQFAWGARKSKGFSFYRFPSGPGEEGGRLRLKAEYYGIGPLGPEDSGPVLSLGFCIPERAPPGAYPIEMVYRAERSTAGFPGRSYPFWTLFATTGDNCLKYPRLKQGSVTVAGDPVQSGECAAALAEGLIHLLSFLFLGGSPIEPPHPRPGGDPTFDALEACPPGPGR